MKDYIKLAKIKYNNKELNLQKFLKMLTIYLEEDDKYNFLNAKLLVIKFRYITKDGEVSYFELPLKIEKKFTNDKFVYFK